MSLLLVQDYYSEEEGEEGILDRDNDHSGTEDGREQQQPSVGNVQSSRSNHSCQVSDSAPTMAASSFLPSPEDLFSEVTGPPEFLKSYAPEPLYSRVKDTWQPSSGTLTPVYSSDPVTDPRPGVVLETKPKSSGPHKQRGGGSEDGNGDGRDGVRSVKGGLRESITAAPRFYTAAEVKISDAEKRSRSKIKDKEKVKRMKGQSSHATWKSETEMQLRQQFD